MNQKELTKPFMLPSNLENPFGLVWRRKGQQLSTLIVKNGLIFICDKCLTINLLYYLLFL